MGGTLRSAHAPKNDAGEKNRNNIQDRAGVELNARRRLRLFHVPLDEVHQPAFGDDGIQKIGVSRNFIFFFS